MGAHDLNLDAVQCGVEALLDTYPDERALDARAPTGAPRGAHAVLWIDDWWRGADMAREALMAGDFRPERARNTVEDVLLRRVACAAATYSLANEGRSLDYQSRLCALDGRLEDDGVDIDPDAVDVFVEQIASIYATGNADDPGHADHNDPEFTADLAEPA